MFYPCYFVGILWFLWENPPEIIKKGKYRSRSDVCFLHSEKQTSFHSWKPSHSLHLWKLGQLTAISLGWVNSIQTQAPYQLKRVTRSMLHYYMCIMTFGHTNTVITYCPTSLIWLPESSSLFFPQIKFKLKGKVQDFDSTSSNMLNLAWLHRFLQKPEDTLKGTVK